VRRHAALMLFGVAALLLTPGAAGVPDVPGDPTPPIVTPVISGTLGAVGWYTTNVTVNWSVVDPESIILSTTGCNAITLANNTTSTQLVCSAESDGGTTTVSKTFKLDKTPPATSATPSRIADANGWYNHDLTVGFIGNDTTSGLESCSADAAYTGPDTAGTTISGTCRDRAGNTAAANFPLKYDETAPQANPSARTPDANGWFNHAVTIAFQGADATSGVDSCTQTTFAGPDDPSIALTGMCRDMAGNQSTSSSFTFKYDETPPQASATASRATDVNGWYNHPLAVSFAGSDATSGLDFCDATKAYSGPDASNASISGSCRDLAGNVAPRSVVVKYDGTAPQVSAAPARAANANGWYNAPLSVSFAGTDPMSGLASCVGPQSYSGPDNAAAAVVGSCADQAGNVRNASFPLKYDATAPQASASPGRPADGNGWYNHAFAVTFAATDATSGIGSCDAAKTYSAPDSASASLSGTCLDGAGNQSAAASFGFKYDATAPLSTAAPSRQPNGNGWYRAPLSVGFAATDGLSGFDSCDAAKTYSGPDAGSASLSGSCRDRAGNVGAASFPLKYDATAPQTGATPTRQPNGNGWYNAPLSVSFVGTDALSGLDSCDAARNYSGPDVVSGALSGTCLDKAGNAGTASFALKYDATAPEASATASRAANANGWYNAPLGVTFTAIDATSTVDSCDPAKSYSGPDAASVAVGGTCRDKAGNAGAASLPLKYDGTAPLATATPGRQPNASGWYRAPIAVTFAATDGLSGLESCDAAKTYSGPDVASNEVTGACRDKAGNSGSGSFTLKYDATAPLATATASRQPNPAGWYNAPLSVSFAATDATSGLESCPVAQPYSGPDSAFAVVTGTCLDKAGNGSAASLAVKYDQTAPTTSGVPSRPADANDWYNRPLTVSFQGSDLTSGIASCTEPKSYAGPDATNLTLSGTCRDVAGNDGGSGVFAFKYDGTVPLVNAATAVRPPDRGGWYNRPVAFAVQGSDATSGLDSCPALTYTGPDGADASVSAVCIDTAGNRASRPFPLRYDATGPAARANADRGPDANGWYNHAFTVSFTGADPVSGLESCDPPQSYDGPDSSLGVIGGVCLDKAGNVGLASLPVSYDATAPQVTGASPSRPPDANGWYNRALVVSFHGSDVTSQVDTCTQARYSGPDASGASVTGSCRDRAGNGSTAAAFTLRFDSNAPSLTDVRAKPGNGAAKLSWTASPDTTRVEIRRGGKLVYSGPATSFTDRGLKNGVLYRYALTGYDEAANGSTRAVSARPTAPLVSPPAGAAVSAPPRLAWTPVEKATYYNVQLWRRGRILSAWPKGTSLSLRRSWTYAGRRYRLTPGRYRWYVWPGYGRRADKNFGRLLGSSSFVVR
jgi:hypothetical protein